MTDTDRTAMHAAILRSAEQWLETCRRDYLALLSPVMTRDDEARARAERRVDRAVEHLEDIKAVIDAYQARQARRGTT